ncbi:hypothetical protein AAG906_025091 [Vitis piasezkii]
MLTLSFFIFMELELKVESRICGYRWSIDLVILSLESHSWRIIGDSSVEISYELAATLASIQEFMVGTAHALPPRASLGIPFYLVDHYETIPPPTIIVPPPIIPTTDDTRLAEDGKPVASFPAKFSMPDIERYSGIGCPKIHLRLYNTVMRAHGIDDAQLVALFPMSLSGATQRWFALAIRQRPDESISSFVSRWRILKSLVHVAFSVEEAFAQGLWTDTAPSPDNKGKRSVGSFRRSGEVGTISYQHQRPAYHSFYRPPTFRPHLSHPQYQYQPIYVQQPYIAQTSLQPRPSHPRATTPSPPIPYAQRPARQFTSLGMTLTRAFEKLRDAGLIVSLAPHPFPHLIPSHFFSHEHCLYHQIQGHDIERCVEDLDQSTWVHHFAAVQLITLFILIMVVIRVVSILLSSVFSSSELFLFC